MGGFGRVRGRVVPGNTRAVVADGGVPAWGRPKVGHCPAVIPSAIPTMGMHVELDARRSRTSRSPQASDPGRSGCRSARLGAVADALVLTPQARPRTGRPTGRRTARRLCGPRRPVRLQRLHRAPRLHPRHRRTRSLSAGRARPGRNLAANLGVLLHQRHRLGPRLTADGVRVAAFVHRLRESTAEFLYSLRVDACEPVALCRGVAPTCTSRRDRERGRAPLVACG